MPIIHKYNKRSDIANSLVCVGLDSDFGKIPDEFKKSEFPQFEFNKSIINLTHEHAAAYKANIAFYEARGDQGLKELKMTMDLLRGSCSDIFTICDSKRGDIGNTNRGYIELILDWLGFDAMTVSPYLGGESLKPFLERSDKGIIVLCKTSNSGSGEFQDLKIEDRPLWQFVAEKVANEWNKNENCLLVVGATYPEEMKKIREVTSDMTFLVPGVGVQGGDVEQLVKAGKNSQNKGLIINSSRGIIFSDDPRVETIKLKEEINKYR